jgi:uncharacterized protein YndB with AHSA1/START domain
MTDLRITRHFPLPPDDVFDFITRRDRLMQWWGPEGVNLSDADLDFTTEGPWHSVIVNADGKRFKMSGRVTEVSPPEAVEFTWGWHDDTDARGPESRVRIELTAEKGGTRFVLSHRGLPDDESRSNHELGWTSSLRKLERLVA